MKSKEQLLEIEGKTYRVVKKCKDYTIVEDASKPYRIDRLDLERKIGVPTGTTRAPATESELRVEIARLHGRKI